MMDRHDREIRTLEEACIEYPVDFRVNRGLALIKLSGADPLMIDPERLDVGSWSNCPLGQLFGNYSRGLDEMLTVLDVSAAGMRDLPLRTVIANANAFSRLRASTDYERDYAVLTRAWIAELDKWRTMDAKARDLGGPVLTYERG